MKRKEIVSILFVGATAMVLTAAPTWGQSEKKKDSSVGGTQSERVGPGADTPLPKGSPSAGSTEGSKAGKGPGSSSTAQGKEGGSQSGRIGSGADTSTGSRSAASTGGQQDVRQVQEALKDKGHDPGPIDGVMGSQTKQALRDFQKANGLKQTGTLDSQTKEKLNIEGSPSGAGSSRGSGSMGKGDSPKGQKESPAPMGK
jgi:peptidoglycan hydrolase-like protein with peptidoglycan-binding domain